jgi:hypothetical protein
MRLSRPSAQALRTRLCHLLALATLLGGAGLVTGVAAATPQEVGTFPKGEDAGRDREGGDRGPGKETADDPPAGGNGAESDTPPGSGPPGTEEEPPAPEPQLPLPEAGDYEARVLFALVEKLTGREVVASPEDVATAPIRIAGVIGGQDAGLAELRVLLGAHGVFLHARELRRQVKGRPAGERRRQAVWIASRSRLLRPAPEERFLRVFETSPRAYKHAVAALERHLEELRAKHPGEEPIPVTVVSDARTGKILVRAASREALEAVAKVLDGLEQEKRRPPAARDHFYAHNCQWRRAEDIERDLLAALRDKGVDKRVHVVLPRGSNALWVRTRPVIWEETVAPLLAQLDRLPGSEPGREPDPSPPPGDGR